VLKAIEHLECSKEFRERNFSLATYNDAQGKERPVYFVTRDGFWMLTFWFTGAKAAVAERRAVSKLIREARASLARLA
jgi:Rha family phage regulatory protein